jgi:3' exoribonuclease, RNase T-like
VSRFFFDTEFIEDGRTIDLLSIGIAHESGATYYAESSEADLTRASSWVKDHVLPHLGTKAIAKPRAQIRAEMQQFIEEHSRGEKIEIWAYYADYDWVAFCQLFGTMMDLPKGFPKYCRDLKQLADDLGVRLPDQTPTDGPEHLAVADARWALRAYKFLMENITQPY